MEILQEKDGVDTELLVYAMTLINKVTELYCLPFFKFSPSFLLNILYKIISINMKLISSSPFFFFCRHLQPYQTRILSMTWWTVWKNSAWKRCPKDIWVGKAQIWTWSSSSTSTRSATLMIPTYLLILQKWEVLENRDCHVSVGQTRLDNFCHQLLMWPMWLIQLSL